MRKSLLAPFAVLGACGGLFTWIALHDAFHSALKATFAVPLLLETPIICGALGWFLSGQLERRWKTKALFLTLLAGAVNGMVVGGCDAFRDSGARYLHLGLGIGGIFGLLFALPFLPPVLHLCWL